MNIIHNNDANRYFFNRMENIFVDRGVYNVVETFKQYLDHRYRNNCYEYSSTAIMGMQGNDYLVRGTLTLSSDWRWENGGYGHGWIEFLYDGKEFVFDSRCSSIILKQDWYKQFNPQNIVKFTKKEILDIIFTNENIIHLSDESCQVKDIYNENDINNIFNPFRKSKIYFEGKNVKKFIAFKEFCN